MRDTECIVSSYSIIGLKISKYEAFQQVNIVYYSYNETEKSL